VGIVYASAGPEAPWRVRDVDGHDQDLRIQRRLRLDDVQAMADAALAGVGLVRLPRWLAAPHLRSGALTMLRDGEFMPNNEVHAVWPRSRHLPLKTRVAIDLLAAQLPPALGMAPGAGAAPG
jgi:DNA-binding transcriptional LysR family regulator